MKSKSFSEIKMGKNLPTEGNSSCLDPESSDFILHIRRRGNRQDIKNKNQCPNWNNQNFITEKKDY